MDCIEERKRKIQIDSNNQKEKISLLHRNEIGGGHTHEMMMI